MYFNGSAAHSQQIQKKELHVFGCLSVEEAVKEKSQRKKEKIEMRVKKREDEPKFGHKWGHKCKSVLPRAVRIF
jgi:hypothetical protein